MPSHPKPVNPRPHATPAEIQTLRSQLLGTATVNQKIDPYAEHRKRMLASAESDLAVFTTNLDVLLDGTEDSDAVRAIYRSLLTVQQRTKRAIGKIPNSAIALPSEPADEPVEA